ncbi:MAG: bifunctional diaminohydroxyphosphoribosylaminopyrimidine deaminase/5-amino-6-(5-phosphoribosylamino)uracil reductase RibD [Acidobacteria bacterium]|nr:MAG: bifunctional diaminohydroxyphosphoribosylaminopyrimidine deaminase/5-amino-6-(5-phosphoribosylamino)uracil reductase RibD [Acidobacteriota bacterium]
MRETQLSGAARQHLRHALKLAARGRYRTSPNPMVGCVVARGEQVISTGYHRRAGGPHAEVEALRQAGSRARGATLYVTLEPCNHHGRTPPCTEAVIAAGIARVVACHRDPNPAVAGGGFARLRAAGIEVESGLLVPEAVRLNWRFLAAARYRRPAVTLKWAMSLDGRIATAAGESQWISSPAGRRWGLEERETHDAILVGSGTALADDPRLDRRLRRAGRPNVRVILDRRLRLSPAARLFTVPGEVLVYARRGSPADNRRALEARGATVVELEKVEPAAVLADLFDRGVASLLIEGGAEVAAAFVEARLFDRVAVDCAPILIGGRTAPGPVGGAGIPRLADALRLADLRLGRRGGDLLITGFRDGCLPDLYASVGGS